MSEVFGVSGVRGATRGKVRVFDPLSASVAATARRRPALSDPTEPHPSGMHRYRLLASCMGHRAGQIVELDIDDWPEEYRVALRLVPSPVDDVQSTAGVIGADNGDWGFDD